MCYPAKPNQRYRCECHMLARRPSPTYESPEWYAAREAARKNPLGRTSMWDGVDLVEYGRETHIALYKERKARRRNRKAVA